MVASWVGTACEPLCSCRRYRPKSLDNLHRFAMEPAWIAFSNTMTGLSFAPLSAHLVHRKGPVCLGLTQMHDIPTTSLLLCRYLPRWMQADAEVHVHIPAKLQPAGISSFHI